jgi:general secretion pathway protein G
MTGTENQFGKPIFTAAKHAGFTLIELLVVMAILALLLTLATPRYFNHIEKSKEVVLRQNLVSVRDAIDKYYSDTGKYPETLGDLVTKKYLRRIAFDPITDSAATWIIVPPEQADKGGVYDIRSGAPGKARDGSVFKEW